MLKRNWLTVLVLVTVLALTFGITSVFADGGEVLNGEEGDTEGYCGGEEMTEEAMEEAMEETMEEMMGDYDHTSGCGEDTLDGMGGGGMMGGGTTGGGMMGSW